MTVHKCIQCKKVMTGRSDKKFCDDGCRNSYHNRRYGRKTVSIKQVNSILRKNRRILQVFIPGNDTIHVPKRSLESKGFDFRFFTGMEKKGRKTLMYCYDVGYSLAEDGLCEMVPNAAIK